ncbi:MAG: hypothetical protein ACLFUB_15495 [Cyclobacteriaceae bacterium]
MEHLKIALTAIMFFVSGVVFCQNDSQTLFSKTPEIGFYVSPGMQVGPLAGETAGFAAFKGGITFAQQFTVGGLYSFSFNEFTPSAETDQDIYMDVQLGGLLLEYTLSPSKLFHFTFPLAVGAGEIQMDWKESSPNYNNDVLSEDNFFFVEPGAMLEINLARYIRLNTGLTYRLVPGGVDFRSYDASDISGFTGSFGLKFGIFE